MTQKKAVLVEYWVHTRRKFIETEQSMSKGKSGKAGELILYGYLAKLFEVLPKRKKWDALDELLSWNITLV